jgi:hypothetical protein
MSMDPLIFYQTGDASLEPTCILKGQILLFDFSSFLLSKYTVTRQSVNS